MIGNGEVGINNFGSRIVLDTFNNRVFNHEVFGVAKRFSFGASSQTHIVINPIEKGAYPHNTLVFLPITVKSYGAGPIEIDIYVGTNSNNDGTLWESTDRNFIDPLTAHLTWRLNPTITNIGIKTPTEYSIYSSAGVGNSEDVGGEIKTSLLFIPVKTVAQTIRLTNTDASNAGIGHISANWFEVV